MKKSDLMLYVGKRVNLYFKDGYCINGVLKYADKFSAEHYYHKPNYFYIYNVSFKVSHVKKIILENGGEKI